MLHAIEARTLEYGITVNVALDGSGCAECPIENYSKEEIRLVTFSRRDGVYDSGNAGHWKSNDFYEPDDVVEFAETNNFWIFSVFKYEHGGVAYSVNPFSCSWDSGQAGYVMLSKKTWPDESEAAIAAKSNIEYYSDWANGNIYGYTINNSNGDELDSCWGYIGDYDDCLNEGILEAGYYVKEAAKAMQITLDEAARDMESSRPDMYANA